MKMALLIIDMQKAYYKNHDKESMDCALEYINYALKLFRKNNCKIIWIQHEDKEDSVIGTEGFEIIDILKPLENEKIIIKKYNNSFNKTELNEYLVKEEIETIIITGYCAEYCVLSTYRGALDNDFKPKILNNAIASGNEEHIRFVVEICETITIKVLEEIINNKNVDKTQ